MIRSTALRGETPPEQVTIPGQDDPAAAEKARRERIMIVGGLSVLGVVVAGSLALVYLTKEKRSHLDRRPLRAGQNRCITHIKYRVVNDYGKLRRIGTC